MRCGRCGGYHGLDRMVQVVHEQLGLTGYACECDLSRYASLSVVVVVGVVDVAAVVVVDVADVGVR